MHAVHGVAAHDHALGLDAGAGEAVQAALELLLAAPAVGPGAADRHHQLDPDAPAGGAAAQRVEQLVGIGGHVGDDEDARPGHGYRSTALRSGFWFQPSSGSVRSPGGRSPCLSAMSSSGLSRSIGSGKTTVEFWSAPISISVCR